MRIKSSSIMKQMVTGFTSFVLVLSMVSSAMPFFVSEVANAISVSENEEVEKTDENIIVEQPTETLLPEEMQKEDDNEVIPLEAADDEASPQMSQKSVQLFSLMSAETTVCASGCDYTSLQTAIDNTDDNGTVTVMSNLSIASQVTITRPVTIIGGGFTLSPTFTKNGNDNNSAIGVIGTNGVTISDLVIEGVNGTTLHGINIYESTDINLKNLTVKDNDYYGVVVNGSTVTIDAITTSGNGWGGINVAQGSGVTTQAHLTITGDNYQSEFPSVYAEGSEPNVVFTDSSRTGQYEEWIPGLGVYLPSQPVPTPACNGSTFDLFALGSVNGQYGWSSTGSYDQSVENNTYGYTNFGCKTLRISNAVTNGSFGDQTFSAPTPNNAGETTASTTGVNGTRHNHYEASFDLGSTQALQQAGLALSISPDRGDGSRMSYLRLEDGVTGINVYFDDVQGEDANADFVETQIAGGTASTPALDRTQSHSLKFVIDFVDGPSNDVVKIYIDNMLVHTGTTWENYYRYIEGTPDTIRAIDSLLIRAAGTAAPATQDYGFLFDNVSVATSTATQGGGSGNGGSGSGGTGGGTVTPVTSSTGPISILPSANNTSNFASSAANVLGVATPEAADKEETLGAQTKKQAANTAAVKASDKGWIIYGLAWYWWLLILLLLGALAWFIAAYRRRRAEEN